MNTMGRKDRLAANMLVLFNNMTTYGGSKLLVAGHENRGINDFCLPACILKAPIPLKLQNKRPLALK
jgi:hypothetical protein